LKSQNPVNVVQATMKALQALSDPKEELARRKGLSTDDVQEDEA